VIIFSFVQIKTTISHHILNIASTDDTSTTKNKRFIIGTSAMSLSLLSAAKERALLSLATVPSLHDWINVAIVTAVTTIIAGFVTTFSGFIDPTNDYDPPWRRGGDGSFLHWSLKPLSAFIFPSLFEEVIWRGALIAPHPSTLVAGGNTIAGTLSSPLMPRAGMVLGIHVLLHPVAGYTIWPRGKTVFGDWRFLSSATILLGGTTFSYIMSGGSAYAAAFTHGVGVALWRDFFGGEAKLLGRENELIDSESNEIEQIYIM